MVIGAAAAVMRFAAAEEGHGYLFFKAVASVQMLCACLATFIAEWLPKIQKTAKKWATTCKYPFGSQRRVFSTFDQNFNFKIRAHQKDFL